MSQVIMAHPVPMRRRRWPWVVLCVSLFPLLSVIAFVTFHLSEAHANRKKVAEAIARIEQDDPEWHLEQFEANRISVPDEKNGAFRVLAAHQQLPRRWPGDDLAEFWRNVPPEQRLPPEQSARLAAELERQQAALTEAREVRNYRTGRYSVTSTANPLGTRVPHIDAIRRVSFLLEADAVNRAETGDIRQAVESCRAILTTGQTLGDEGFMIAAFVRCNCRERSVITLERTLAQGEPSSEALASIRQQFEFEAQARIVENSLRFERAEMNDVCDSIESGRFSLEAFKVEAPSSAPPTTWEKVEGLWVTPRILEVHAQMLNTLTDAIEVARGPLEERSDFADTDEIGGRPVNFYAGLLMPSLSKPLRAEVRSIAYLRCAAVAVGAEQYRRKSGHWPSALADLAGDFPNGLPADSFDGAPLRFKQLPDGIVIYSVGQDRTDDGGLLYRVGSENKPKNGYDIGFRLWDVDKRRQPAITAPKP